MTPFEPGLPPSQGRLDRDGNLVSAEARLLELNAHAGGAIGSPIAIPAIASLARLSRRLRIDLHRTVAAADGGEDLMLWVLAQPDEDGVRLAVGGWQATGGWEQQGDPERDAATLASGADWVWEADASLHLVALAPAAGTLPAIDPATLLGRPLTRLLSLAEDGDGGFPILGAVAQASRFDGQEAIVRATGEAVRLAAIPRADAAGRFAGFVGAAWRTGRAPADQPGLPAGFTRRLNAALRDPLSRIIANADSISARADGPLRQDYAEYATDIAAAGRHLMALVNDLEDLSAIERADFTVATEPLDLADVARRAAGLLAVRAQAGDVRIDRPDADDRLIVTGEFRRVLQILVNLIGNAVRYSPPGAMVWIRLERDEGVGCVIVADQGKGIAPEDQARIFEKFQRVDPSEPGGSGLGLYIARRLARAMGGDILLDSAPGQGARFVLTLPVVAAESR